MIRILLVDDEQIALDSLEHIIKRSFEETEIAKARSGREAIERAEQLRPHIVITDIKMPGINGIDTIREIKAHSKETRFVVISAYEQFVFARDAMELGVVEYLLKPVNRLRMIEVLRRVIEQIELERNRRARELRLQEKVEHVLPSLENGFVVTALFFDNNAGLVNYKALFELTSEVFYVMTIEFISVSNNPQGQIDVSEAGEKTYVYCRDALKELHPCFVGPLMGNCIIAFIPAKHGAQAYTYKAEASALAESLLARLPKRQGMHSSIGIGRVYEGLSYLKQSYAESTLALRHRQNLGLDDNMVMHIDDVQEMMEGEYPLDKEKSLIDCVETGDEAGALGIYDELFDALSAQFLNDLDKMKCKSIEIVAILNRMEIELGGLRSDAFDGLNMLIRAQNLLEIKRFCSLMIGRVARRVAEKRKTHLSQLVMRAKAYIDQHYSESIMLEDIARTLNISPYYLSRLYKAETGYNFIDYLTHVRIEAAKTMVVDLSLSMKEIAFAVGYSDPNYFSRLFKKVTGCTPTEYKDSSIH